jgi:hypothetical protein
VRPKPSDSSASTAALNFLTFYFAFCALFLATGVLLLLIGGERFTTPWHIRSQRTLAIPVGSVCVDCSLLLVMFLLQDRRCIALLGPP